ncbi:helix-turn-helix transcriptional regulator [Prolixibacteraceae bacterium Z1-6]|uniref:Helix-turn-helix transcriptional regulator n=1 Tax=Draconibacterium aestuarii TaxID=2998507 RepID=A0A9X3F2A4_9BACT|nr:helix-turn-helix transcriptional regulator [Prolixibacteraceae bacterium Z1-6]
MKSKEIQEHNKNRIEAITHFLKWYRINNQFSQQELSEYSGVHRNTIVQYESNCPKNLTLVTIFKIADALELDINQIFMDIE